MSDRLAGARSDSSDVFDLPMESFDALRQMAKSEGQSSGDLVRELVQQALFMEGYLDVDGKTGVLEYVAKRES